MKKLFLMVALSFGLTFSASAGVWNSILLWLPNRVLDAADIVSVGVGGVVGPKIEARVTRAVDFSLSDNLGSCMVRWDHNRWLGVTQEQGHHINFLYFGCEECNVDEALEFKVWNFPLPGEYTKGSARPMCYKYSWWCDPFSGDYDLKTGTRDWWEIAVEAGFFGGARVAVHPIEIADFVCGIFFIDFKEDDITL